MKIRFNITYANPLIKKAADFLKNSDLGEIEFMIEEQYELEISRDKVDYETLSRLLFSSFESVGCKVRKIEFVDGESQTYYK